MNSYPEEINEVHPDFFEMLVLNGFIIEDNIDEFKLVENKLKNVINRKDVYRLIINPTMNCNFKCWYCYETHIKDSKMDKNNIDKITKFISNILDDEIKLLQISFFGGEPLLYYSKVVKPILEYANAISTEKNIFINSDFTTNGFLIDENMIESFKKLNVKNLQITLDGHKELHDNVRYISKKRGSYDKNLDNIFLLANAPPLSYYHTKVEFFVDKLLLSL